jgi:hypothetical protein
LYGGLSGDSLWLKLNMIINFLKSQSKVIVIRI